MVVVAEHEGSIVSAIRQAAISLQPQVTSQQPAWHVSEQALEEEDTGASVIQTPGPVEPTARRNAVPAVGAGVGADRASAAGGKWGRKLASQEKLVEPDLERRAAPDFTLTVQRGETVQLSALTGKSVVLTLTSTNCPDTCPITAELPRPAYEQLPAGKRDDVAKRAMTVDPDRDTTEALTAFSRAHRLDAVPAWHALRGEPDDLEAI